jgi:hypothetical protein
MVELSAQVVEQLDQIALHRVRPALPVFPEVVPEEAIEQGNSATV